MYTALTSYSKKFQLVIPIILGCIYFQLLVGINIIDPQNLNWIFGRFDPPQHYLGWLFYRNSPWTFPPGASPSFGMEVSSSIVFTDSIPLMAMLFKLLSPVLPVTFQYFGIWILLCFILQAIFAWKILSFISNETSLKILGTSLLVFSPPMIWRLATPSGTHSALFAHFLILAAIYLVLTKEKKNTVLYWGILLCISVLIHFYLFIIVSIIWIADLMDRLHSQKVQSIRSVLIEIILIGLSVFICAWLAGYFLIASSSGSDLGYGFFRLNVLGPINSEGWSYVLPSIAMPTSWGEGFNYLGIGVIFLILMATIIVVIFCIKKINLCTPIIIHVQRHQFLITALILCYVFALSNKIAVGINEFHFDLPANLSELFGILRTSARLYWPIHYSVVIFAVYIIQKFYSPLISKLIIGSALVFQIADSSPGWLKVRNDLNQNILNANYAPNLSSNFWGAAVNKYKNIELIPVINQNPVWVQFAYIASKFRLQTNAVHFARIDSNKLSQLNMKLNTIAKSGNFNPESLYVFDKKFLIPILASARDSDLIAQVDNFYVLAPNWLACGVCNTPPDIVSLREKDIALKNDREIKFSNSEEDQDSSLYLYSGWSWQESWGVWSDGNHSVIHLPWPKFRPKFITVDFKAFVVNKIHPLQQINIVVNGVFYRTVEAHAFENNKLIIPISKQMFNQKYLTLEFEFLNAKAPSSLGIENLDKRKLGMGLTKISFN